jgi:hypothetical protein
MLCYVTYLMLLYKTYFKMLYNMALPGHCNCSEVTVSPPGRPGARPAPQLWRRGLPATVWPSLIRPWLGSWWPDPVYGPARARPTPLARLTSGRLGHVISHGIYHTGWYIPPLWYRLWYRFKVVWYTMKYGSIMIGGEISHGISHVMRKHIHAISW